MYIHKCFKPCLKSAYHLETCKCLWFRCDVYARMARGIGIVLAQQNEMVTFFLVVQKADSIVPVS